MKNIVITIGREYGSGGRYIGLEVAKRLGIPFYDKSLIGEASKKYSSSYSDLIRHDERKSNKILEEFNRINSSNIYNLTSYEYQHIMEETIKEIADRESCVILGRNSNNILKGKENVINIFIYSNDYEFKIQRKMDIENITRDESIRRIKNVDNQRRKYYESVNDKQIWGNRRGYDLLIDSSVLGVDKTVDYIVDLYKLKSK